MRQTFRRYTAGLALTIMVSAGLTLGTAFAPAMAAEATKPDPAATKAAIAAAQILVSKDEAAAARELLRGYLFDDKAVLIYVRAGLASKATTTEDFELIARLTEAGNLAGARILGDMLRTGAGVAADLPKAEAAYRYAIKLGDTVSRGRLADLLQQMKRYPEAIAAYAELRDDPRNDVAYTVLSLSRGNLTDPAQVAELVAHLDTLSLTDAGAARAAASMYERGTGVAPDAIKAVTYAKRAVALGDTKLGLMVAEDCDTCTALELVGLLKATAKLDDAEKTGKALEKPLARGLYSDAWEIINRFPPGDRTAIVRHMLNRFGAVSNPVVALTQSLMLASSEYTGGVDGLLTTATLAAVQRYGAARNVALVNFDDALVTALFASAE